jgi:hypothetical protein
MGLMGKKESREWRVESGKGGEEESREWRVVEGEGRRPVLDPITILAPSPIHPSPQLSCGLGRKNL